MTKKNRKLDRHKNTTGIARRSSKMLWNAKYRAKQAGVEFDLDREWVLARLFAGVCEASGVKFDCSSPRHQYTPSIDRVVPNKGYVKSNCRVVALALNQAKNQYTDADIKELSEKWFSHRPGIRVADSSVTITQAAQLGHAQSQVCDPLQQSRSNWPET